ncbi:MAG: hypothetical protein KGO81_11155 [Bacteroidota bacterium]|nr:hypothetical protein [Bacteroidota bacterium]
MRTLFDQRIAQYTGFCVIFFLLVCTRSLAQQVAVNDDLLMDYLRAQSLRDTSEQMNRSLCVLPGGEKWIAADTFLSRHYYSPLVTKKHIGLGLIPLSLTQKYNSHHPYGWNGSSFYPTAGYQARLSTGFYARLGPLQLQLQPEYVYAANPAYEHGPHWGTDTKTMAYHQFFPGQSSINLQLGATSFSVSTANAWWGPGIYNSLMMSNNAPGFLHASFHSNRPVKTVIGSFEWELMAGKLVEDTNVVLENKDLLTSVYNPDNYNGTGFSDYHPENKWRYLNAVTLTYQPKWVPHLFVGITRVAYAYNDNLTKDRNSFLHNYFPTIFGVFRNNYAYGSDTGSSAKRYKQLLSFHAKYIFRKSHLEVHAEYGWDDNFWNVRDFFLDIPHSAAYTLGFIKMWPVRKGYWMDVTGEVTQMAQTTDYLVRTSGYWYLYQGGYTEQSRVIGAGVGAGNNVQTLALHLRGKGFTQWGCKLLRVQHDPMQDNPYQPLITLGQRPQKWTDIAVGVNANLQYKKMVFSGEMQWVTSRNYAWQENVVTGNLYALLTVRYLW